jgi:hypothetical protein
MKRLLLIAALCVFNVAHAQQDKDTLSYPSWWGYYYPPLDTMAIFFDTDEYDALEVASPGYYEYLQFEVIQPLLVYGIAVTPTRKGPRFYRTFHNLPGEPDPPNVDSSALDLYAVLIQKEGDRFVQVDSAKWHWREPDKYFRYTARHPNPSRLHYSEVVVPVYEFYFDTPHFVYDSFYIGFKSDYAMSPNFDSTVANSLHYPQQWAFHTCFMVNGVGLNNSRTWYMPRWGKQHHGWVSMDDDPLLVGPSFWGGLFPIIIPPDTDAVVSIPVTGFHQTDDYDGWPVFLWNGTAGQELYELSYGPADQDTDSYQVVSTTYSWLILRDSTLDSTVVYAARCRARNHHACALHDTVMWSRWTDTVQFWTGRYRPGSAPDDSVGIVSPSDAVAFTLSPNPAKGQVAVRADIWEPYSVAVRDEQGREVLRRKLAAGTRTLTIDVADYPSGTYFVTLTTAKGTSTQKLVVEN